MRWRCRGGGGRRAGPCMRCPVRPSKHRQAGRLPWCGLPRRRRWRPRRHQPRRLRSLQARSLQPACAQCQYTKSRPLPCPPWPPRSRRRLPPHRKPRPHWPRPRRRPRLPSLPGPCVGGAEELRSAAGGTSAQERQQARIVPHQRWTANAASNGATGGDMRLTEQYGAGGVRVTRVQRGAAVYCVEAPSANQPPAMGAAPRIVLPRNCS